MDYFVLRFDHSYRKEDFRALSKLAGKTTRKWSSRTAIRSGSILPQNTVTAAFACRDGKHDFYACVDQKNHRIFPLPKKLPAKNSDNFAVCGRIGVASVGKKL